MARPAGAKFQVSPSYVREMAVTTGLDGRPILVTEGGFSGGDSGHAAIRAWDPFTGRPIGPPLDGHHEYVACLAAGGRAVG